MKRKSLGGSVVAQEMAENSPGRGFHQGVAILFRADRIGQGQLQEITYRSPQELFPVPGKEEILRILPARAGRLGFILQKVMFQGLVGERA